MRTFDRYANAAKVVALCLPPVIVSLAGLMALSRGRDRAARAVGNEPAARRREPASSGGAGGTGRDAKNAPVAGSERPG